MEIYTLILEDEFAGIVVMALEKNEAVFVNIVGNIDFLLETLYQIAVIVLFLNVIISTACLRKILVDIRFKINGIKEKEKNVKECYQYDQLLNPPIMNN